MPESDLIKKIRKKDKAAIKELYVKYAPVMLSLCLRYTENREEAKDTMHEGFIKILTGIDKYSGTGSFEGWMKRIVIYTAIDHYKKKKKYFTEQLNDDYHGTEEEDSLQSLNAPIDKKDINPNHPDIGIIRQAELSMDEMMAALKELPEKYRIVFNLFVLERYTHKEVAELLELEEGLCRTRLSRAREMLKKILYLKSIERIAK